jgi:LPXTG-motif cell wall-anchored protein
MDSSKQWSEFVGSTEENVSQAIERAKDAAKQAVGSRSGRAARHLTDRVERAVASRPENALWRTLWLTLAGAATLGSLGMFAVRRKHESLYIGQWVPVLMMLALWGQIVRD